jgi:hypothetical protein
MTVIEIETQTMTHRPNVVNCICLFPAGLLFRVEGLSTKKPEDSSWHRWQSTQQYKPLVNRLLIYREFILKTALQNYRHGVAFALYATFGKGDCPALAS